MSAAGQPAVTGLIEFLETGKAPDGLFAPDVFADFTPPQWRLQTATADDLVAMRNTSHPATGEVRVERLEQTEHGFTMEVEERWLQDGEHFYCREMFRADVVDDAIVELSVYCTGDWDAELQRQHAAAVHLLRP